ncbi:hypothetical protein VPNG_08500 [Cytospora leucostoma]|uniref:Uncharacterized protein n=1 Tax=Cytospora leucostoma TaxID=1230097 RepID=A0A423W536_9PEZI|nr:hypothetical protein VPNG_08500 [Cytospora leucostoma]
MLPDGTGPWSPQFAVDAVDDSKDLRSEEWFQIQRENEDRGFHCIKTDKGRKALHNLTDWSFTQCWDPRARYALYHNVAWPQPSKQEVRSELARLRALARAGNHYAPAPDWRWAPGLEVQMDSSPRNEDLHPSDAGEGPDSPPTLVPRGPSPRARAHMARRKASKFVPELETIREE